MTCEEMVAEYTTANEARKAVLREQWESMSCAGQIDDSYGDDDSGPRGDPPAPPPRP